MTDELKIKIQQAKEFGKLAFSEGKKSIPCLDKNVMNLLESGKNDECNPIFKAWLHSWTQANLAVPFDFGKAPLA